MHNTKSIKNLEELGLQSFDLNPVEHRDQSLEPQMFFWNQVKRPTGHPPNPCGNSFQKEQKAGRANIIPDPLDQEWDILHLDMCVCKEHLP